MKVITRPECPVGGTVVTIGAYDGVHLGHRALIDEVRRRGADAGLETAVATFDRHPAMVVRPESAPKLLTDLDQKLELLASTGVDYTLVIEFDQARSRESAEDFVREFVAGCLHARSVVVGRDFHFGHGRRGNVGLLEKMGTDTGFEVVGLDLVAEGSDVVSSTRIRQLLGSGLVEEASRLLGRDHQVRGVVVPGDSRGGAELGYPTANLSVPPDILLPLDGIYAGWFSDSKHPAVPAALYVGRRPTFYGDAGELTLEAYLIEFSDDLYGGDGQVSFVKRLRSDQRFDSAGALVDQMTKDVNAARAALAL